MILLRRLYNTIKNRVFSNKPDFLIIGAQKCGTTSLFFYLAQHPGLVMPKTKEVHFFDQQYEKGITWYYNQFPKSSIINKKLTGEASPYYLFHPLVPERVFKHLPNIKIIVLLRNPVDRAYSHFMHEKKYKREFLDSFEEAVETENIRTDEDEKKLIAGEIQNSESFQRYSYLKRGLYHKQISRWLQYFRFEQFCFIKSEDFFQNPEKELIHVCDFLGITHSVIENLAPLNTNKYTDLSEYQRRKLNNFFADDSKKLKGLIGEKFCWD